MPTPWPLSLEAVGPEVACGALLWRAAGTPRATLVLAASFATAHGRDATPVLATPLRRDDPGAPPAERALRASALAPQHAGAGVILVGHAHAPSGSPVAKMSVRLAVYRDAPVLDRTLHVFGDRRPGASEPAPFEKMPLVYERAQRSEANPVGTTGTANLYDATDPRRAAAFGPIPASWPQRARWLGAHDAAALEREIPDVPAGLDPRFFHAAPPEQQVERLAGDEWIVLDGMHPTLARVQTRLPSARGRARVHVVAGPGAGAAHDVALQPDELVIDVDRERLVLVFRGELPPELVARVAQLHVQMGVDIAGRAVVWPERRDARARVEEPPASVAPARAAAAASLELGDEEEGTAMLSTADFERHALQPIAPFAIAAPGARTNEGAHAIPGAPWSPAAAAPAPHAIADEETTTGVAVSAPALPFAAPAGGAAASSKPPAAASSSGLPFVTRAADAAPIAPAFVAPPATVATPAFVAPPAPAPVVAPAPVAAFVAPPEPVAPSAFGAPSAVSTATPPMPERVQPASPPKPDTLGAPIAPAQPHSAGDAPDPDGARGRVLARLDAGRSLDDLDLSGADLAGLDFRRASMARCNLRGARLAGCVLAGARLEGAALTGADLTGADLSGADLTGADLVRATLEKARFDGARLDEAKLGQASGADASFRRAKGQRTSFSRGAWERAHFDDAEIERADFTGGTLDGASFANAKLPGARLIEASANGASFSAATLADVRAKGASLLACRFEGADLSRGALTNAALEGARFDGARLEAARFEAAALAKATFTGADLRGATLEGAELEGASLEGANLEGARLSGANGRGVVLRGATLDRAELRGASLPDSELRDAALRDARCEDVELDRARLDGATLSNASLRGARLDGAVLAGARLDQADLRSASLVGANLHGAARQSAKMTGADTAGVVETAPER